MSSTHIHHEAGSLQNLKAPTPLRAMIEELIGSNRLDALRLLRASTILNWSLEEDPTPTLTIGRADTTLQFVYDTSRELRAVHIVGGTNSIALDGVCELSRSLASHASAHWVRLDTAFRNDLTRAIQTLDLRSFQSLGAPTDTTTDHRLAPHRWERKRVLETQSLFAGEPVSLRSEQTTVHVYGPEGEARRAAQIHSALRYADADQTESAGYSWWASRPLRWLSSGAPPLREHTPDNSGDTHSTAHLRFDTTRLDQIAALLGIFPSQALDGVAPQSIHRFLITLSQQTLSMRR